MPRAILSVYDKSGLVDFASGLSELGWSLIASGGTARSLRQAGLTVSEVADYTGSPEILGGRVKTLHPAIHGGLLARPVPEDQDQLKQLGWELIDLVAVNLYPFEETIARPEATLEEAIENIDIGGVALMRAAAKNFARVSLVCDPADYPSVLAELQAGGVSPERQRALAVKGFRETMRYDAAIYAYLAGSEPAGTQAGPLQLELYPVSSLRYGENPHQQATLYAYQPDGGPLGGSLLQGKALSYNNLLDLDAAWRAAIAFERPTVCIVKHLSPCGLASGDSLAAAYPLALESDPISAFGGVIASNRPFDDDTAHALGDLFVECIAAPGFEPAARQTLGRRKNLRLVDMPNLKLEPRFELRSVNGGVLRQSVDLGDPPGTEWRVGRQRPPGEAGVGALRLARKGRPAVKIQPILFWRGEGPGGDGGRAAHPRGRRAQPCPRRRRRR